MTVLKWIHTIWDYNYWAHHKLLHCVQTISDEDFKRPVDYSIGSIHVQVVHVMWAEDVWYQRIHNKPIPTYVATDFPTCDSIREQWKTIETNWRAYLAGLTDSELNHYIKVTSVGGHQYERTVMEMLLHAVNHGTNHRAQILQLLHGYGGETFEQDMSFYFREKA